MRLRSLRRSDTAHRADRQIDTAASRQVARRGPRGLQFSYCHVFNVFYAVELNSVSRQN